MRIIGGQWRGRRLYAPEGMETRPTSDKVREALFNIIQRDVPGAQVLDLFAGSGALSLEALSRGAEAAVMTEPSRKAAQAVRRNIELCGAQDTARLIPSEWQAALAQLAGRRFSLVFLDPPWRMTGAYNDALNRLFSAQLLSEDALIVMEHSREAELAPLPEAFEMCDTRRYGDTCLSLVRLRSEEA